MDVKRLRAKCCIIICYSNNKEIECATGWLIGQNLIMSVGHLLYDANYVENRDFKFEAKFQDNKVEIKPLLWEFDCGFGIDFAIYGTESNISEAPLEYVEWNKWPSNFISYGYSANNERIVPVSGTILGESSDSENKQNMLVLESDMIGEAGFSGSPIYSIEDKGVVAIQTESNINDLGAGRNRAFAFPLRSLPNEAKALISTTNRRISSEIVCEIYNMSKSSIKDSSFYFLGIMGDTEKRFEKVQRYIYSEGINSQFEMISDLFQACYRGRKYTNIRLSNYKEIIIDGNIFEWIMKEIKDFSLKGNENNNPIINIRGECNVGKSTLLGVLYIFLLKKFLSNQFDCVPFYYNLEKTVKTIESDDIDDIYKKICNHFDIFIDQCSDLSCTLNIPMCIIIDGLDRYGFLSSSKNIEQYILSKTKGSDRNKYRYIMSINNYDFYQKNDREDQFKSKRVIFINEIDVVYNGYKRDIFYNFINSYAKLFSIIEPNHKKNKNIEKIFDDISKYRKISISLNFLYNNFVDLIDIEESSNSWEVLCAYNEVLKDEVQKHFNIDDYDQIKTAAYAFQFGKLTYEDYIKLEKQYGRNYISYDDYCKIKSKPDMRKYLISEYFMDQLKYYSDKDKVDEDSILCAFLTRDISLLVRLNLQGSESILDTFIKNYNMHDLHEQIVASLIYLCGHSKDGHAMRRIIEIEKKLDSKSLLLMRSLYMAKIVASENNLETTNTYLEQLIWNSEVRYFNRAYQLKYYEDHRDIQFSVQSNINFMDVPLKGMDFHNCFLVLVSKLKSHLQSNDNYPLMWVDLFTLCDIVTTRLITMNVQGDNKETPSFFYSKKYNIKGQSRTLYVLDILIYLLDNYIPIYRSIYNETFSSTYVYLSTKSKKFKEIRGKINNNSDTDVGELYISNTEYLSKIFSIIEMPRIGWNIKSVKQITEQRREELNSIQKNVYERYGHSILQALYIALFYLPENCEINENYSGTYDKNKIIQIILLHDLGKVEKGDYTPYSSNVEDLRADEDRVRKDVILFGAMEGNVDLHEMYALLNSFETSAKGATDINFVIANEILLIQLEYMYRRLQSEHRNLFQEDRSVQFEKYFNNLPMKTKLGQEIHEKIIQDIV